jgi:hypothetical protein
MSRQIPFHSNKVWPPALLVGIFFTVYGLVTGGLWLIEPRGPYVTIDFSEFQEVAGLHKALIGIAAAIYAMFRLLRFHPACNRAYATWLTLSPWTAGRPLPAGPVGPVWQDAAVIGALTAIGIWSRVDPLIPLGIFILVYLVGFTFLLIYVRQRAPCLVLGFLWPVLILPEAAGVMQIVILAAIAAVMWYGHIKSLKAFPWKPFRKTPASLLQVDIRIEGIGSATAAGAQYNLGWPFLALSPKTQPPAISQRTNLALGALAGWWSFCVIEASQMNPLPEFILVFSIFAALSRLGIYYSGVLAPFNILGRIVTGRLIVPRFDRIFLTPLAVVLTGILGCIIVKRSGQWYPQAESCVIAAIWFVLFGGGPTLRNWALTGQHRLRPPSRLSANKQMVRSV